MSNWELVAIEFPWILPTIVFIMGLCIGSFLNVCIYRMPRGLSVVWPGSFCPKSNAPLHWWENIPVLSFLFLRGKGRTSHEPIGWQYPAVELLTAVVFLALWFSFPPGVAIAYMIMAAIFIAGSFIDWQFKIIPDSFTIGGMVVGLLLSVWVPQLHGIYAAGIGGTLHSLGISLQGMLIGSAFVLWMAIAGEIAFKREAMGFGDVKLLGMIGAFLGWQGAIFSVFGGAFVGLAVVGVMLIGERLAGKDAKMMGREIPFGPMLCVAALAYVWLKPTILSQWEMFVRAVS